MSKHHLSSPARETATLALKYAAGAAALACAGQAHAQMAIQDINVTTDDMLFFRIGALTPGGTFSLQVGSYEFADTDDFSVRFATNVYGFFQGDNKNGKTVNFMANAFQSQPGFNAAPLIAYPNFSVITGAQSNGSAMFRSDDMNATGWTTGAISYAGWSVTSGSDTYYGWMKMSFDPASHQITIGSIALNMTPGAAAPVPEPAASVALLSAGAAGLVALRELRRRRAKTAPASA